MNRQALMQCTVYSGLKLNLIDFGVGNWTLDLLWRQPTLVRTNLSLFIMKTGGARCDWFKVIRLQSKFQAAWANKTVSNKTKQNKTPPPQNSSEISQTKTR